MSTPQLALGFFLGIVISLAAWRMGSLSRSGAFAAALTGGLVFGLGGLPWAVVLLAFFVSSSALSRLFARRKAALSEKFAKGNRRDWGQVFANGGLGAALAIAYVLFPEYAWPWIAFSGAMAAVNADTWATELGVLNPSPPRLVTTGRPVERGASGAISLYGSLSALAGAALIGLIALVFTPYLPNLAAAADLGLVLPAAILGGLAGSFADSFLGATVQAIYSCPACAKETERHPLHSCGTPTFKVRGWRWLNNDWVNFLCSMVGALVGLFFWVVVK